MSKSFSDFKANLFKTLTEATALERRAEREQQQADMAKAAAAADTRRRRAREARQDYHRNRKRALELGESFKPGDTVHIGHATKGGTGVIGKVVKVEGGNVHIKNDKGDTFKGPVSRATLKNESVKLGEANMPKFDEVLRKGKKLGDWNMMSYFLYDGNVWMLKSGRAVNQGSLETFMKRSQSGLINSLKFESVQEELGLPSDHPDHHVYKSTEHNLKNGGNPTTRKKVQQYATRNRINISSDEAKAINAKGKHGDAFREQQRRVQQHLKDRHTKKESVELDIEEGIRRVERQLKSKAVRTNINKADQATVRKRAHRGEYLRVADTNNPRTSDDPKQQSPRNPEKREGARKAAAARDAERTAREARKRAKKLAQIRATRAESVELDEVSPPGFEGTVKAMKKYKDIDNPWALAWYMKNKGYKSHKTKDGKDK